LLAAEEGGAHLELSGRKQSLDLPLGHERHEPFFEERPAAFPLLEVVEERLGRRELRLVAVLAPTSSRRKNGRS
jgi:hypothetical protein